MDKKKLFGWLNVVFGALVLIGLVWYLNHGSLMMKAITCATFVLLSGVNFVYALISGAGKKYASVMFAGAVFGWLGDVTLGVNFVLGAGLFAVGHILYAAAFYAISPVRKSDILLTGAILIGTAALILLYPKFDFGGALMQGVCLVYGLIISCMVGKAVSGGIREKTLPMIIMAAGSVLFYFSDLMLVLRWFADAPRLAGDLCLMTYFPAQGLLSASIYFYANKEKRNG